MSKKKKPKSKSKSAPKAKPALKAKKKTTKVFFNESLFEQGFWKKNYVPALLIFILGIGLYLRAIPYEYVLDDQIVIVDNIFTKKGFGGLKEIFTTESFQGYFQAQKDLVEGSRYRPLSIATFAIEYELMGGENNEFSHFMNALLYGLCCLLLFRVLSLLFFKYKHGKWYLGIAFAAALLWTVHPLHTEAVANIKGRDEIMALIGSLATLYFSLRYIEKEKILDLVWSGISFFLGLLAKENTITFLAVIPLSIYFFQSDNFKKIAKALVPILAVIVIYLIIRVQIIGYLLDSGKEITDIMNDPFARMNFGEKYATIFYTLLLYLKLNIIPYPQTHDYYPFHIPTFNWSQIWPILSLLAHLALTYIAIIGIKKRRVIAYGIWFYLITISIVSNLVFSVGTFMNERFVFMASIGACIVMAYFVMEMLPKYLSFFKREYALAGIVAISLGYAYKTYTRIPAWKNALSLNSSAVLVSKNSARANVFMSTALFNKYKEVQDQEQKKALIEQAGYYVRRSKSLFPEYHNANLMLAGIAAEEYKYHNDLDSLLSSFKSVAQYTPNLKYLFDYYRYMIDRPRDTQKLFDYFYDVGKNMLIDQQYKYYRGIQYLELAEQLQPNNRELLQLIAENYERIGNTAKAQEYLNKLQ